MEHFGNPVREACDWIDSSPVALGELVYQQTLERSNPAEFKALLERNGIKYNPHYVRGGL